MLLSYFDNLFAQKSTLIFSLEKAFLLTQNLNASVNCLILHRFQQKKCLVAARVFRPCPKQREQQRLCEHRIFDGRATRVVDCRMDVERRNVQLHLVGGARKSQSATIRRRLQLHRDGNRRAGQRRLAQHSLRNYRSSLHLRARRVATTALVVTTVCFSSNKTSKWKSVKGHL